MAAWDEYTKSLQASGLMLGGDAQQTVFTATTVRVRKGEPTTTDGPFAETKEQLGGYYILDCDAETAVGASRIYRGSPDHGVRLGR